MNAAGTALINKQTQALNSWFARHAWRRDNAWRVADTYELLKSVYDVTRAQVGGVQIMQALRTGAPLQQERLKSHREVTDEFCEMLEQQFSRQMDDYARATARLNIETGYALVWMTLEDETLDHQLMLKAGSGMIQAYWAKFLEAYR